MFQYLLFGLSLATAVLGVPTPEDGLKLYKRQDSPPPMTFNCQNMPEICTSMCWGAYCTRPSFGVTLNFDAPDRATRSARRRGAGCEPRPNRCSTNANPPYPSPGFNCDEYPFASTSNADGGGQTNRCVPTGQNSAQGGVISSYLQANCNCGPCQFIVGFGNPAAAGVRYCDAFSDPVGLCQPDGNVYKGTMPDVQPPSRKLKRDDFSIKGGLYETRSGMTVSFGEELEPGTVIMHPREDNISEEERAMAEAKRALNPRQDTSCDYGDGTDEDAGRQKRTSGIVPPEYEFVEDVIVKKL